ncbi:DUF6475 domain-containing protein [Sulfurimonas sp. HSL-1656]|uniref:DUF6475 domain-containing protein n=1 Tax=Thiomicrolovo subterrani TaxID=3131934 RepID=UPI0031F7E174
MIDFKKFVERYTVLAEEFGETMSDARMKLHYEILSRSMSDDEFDGAVMSVLANRKFHKMPHPAELLEYVRPDIDAIASLALQDLERAFKTKGRVASVAFEDVVINSVVNAMGGWVYLCNLEAREWEFKRREFPQLYKTHSRRDTHIDHLPGTAEADPNSDPSRYLPTVEVVEAGYKIPKVRSVPALNKPKRDVAGMIAPLAEAVRA